MNWGTRITILYLCFAGLIVSMVVISSKNKSELVTKDYYVQELKYQERIDAMTNERHLQASIDHQIQEACIALSFPAKEIAADFSGEVLFFRPSDSSKDLKLNLKFDEQGKQIIGKEKLSKGIYKMCISWKNNKTSYYKEQIITL